MRTVRSILLALMPLAISGCGVDEPQPVMSEPIVSEPAIDLRIDAYEEDLVPINWMGISPSGTLALMQAQD